MHIGWNYVNISSLFPIQVEFMHKIVNTEIREVYKVPKILGSYI